MRQKPTLSVFVSLSIFLVLGCGQVPRYYHRTREIMGTLVTITCPDPQAIDKAFAEIERVDALLSSYKPQSEISRLNAAGRLKACPETMFVVRQARRLYEMSQGAFDITVGQLARLWNIKEKMFLPPGQIAIPSPREIEKVLSRVGMNFVELKKKTGIIILTSPGLRLDLGGIAKGYAVDRAVAVLREAGVSSALIDAGGDIYCLGKKGKRPWSVGLRRPRHNGSVSKVFSLVDRAVATSGDYEQFFLYKGKRYTHIIDPRTGYPVDNGIRSVTVFANDCLTADGLATAIFVLGEKKGRALAAKFEGVEVEIIRGE
ncbi:MAG: FAD:protein FMN transferase [Candidatus Omnitrophota bacterium]